MKTILPTVVAGLLAMTVSSVGLAQQLPPAVVAIVDTQRISQTCTACVGANQQLEAQAQQLQQRAQQLGIARAPGGQPTPLEVEGQAIQTGIAALAPGQQADPALQTRYQNYQTQLQNAQREIEGRELQIRRNRAFVIEQIEQRLNPIIVQIMQQRGANMAVASVNTLAIAPQLDITDAVLTSLNQQLPTVSVNAPPPQQAPAQPQRPQGR